MFGCSSVWWWPHDACKHRLSSASHEIVTVTECNRGHAAEKLLKAAADFGATTSNRGGRKAQALFALLDMHQEHRAFPAPGEAHTRTRILSATTCTETEK
jgi:hypothetical protein